MSNQNSLLVDALAVILKPIVKEALREELKNSHPSKDTAGSGKLYLTVKQAAEASGLGVSTIRLLIRRRQLRAQRVGRRVIILRKDLENFLELNPITASHD